VLHSAFAAIDCPSGQPSSYHVKGTCSLGCVLCLCHLWPDTGLMLFMAFFYPWCHSSENGRCMCQTQGWFHYNLVWGTSACCLCIHLDCDNSFCMFLSICCRTTIPPTKEATRSLVHIHQGCRHEWPHYGACHLQQQMGSMFQYRCFDVVDNIMILLDSTVQEGDPIGLGANENIVFSDCLYYRLFKTV